MARVRVPPQFCGPRVCTHNMSGGAVQLINTGAADAILVGQPQITYWRTLHRRYCNFAIESVPQTWSGTAGFGRRATCTLSRGADLAWRTWVQVRLPALPPELRWCNGVGWALLKAVELEIGGVAVDRQTSEFMDMWTELSEPDSKLRGLNRMVGKLDAWDAATNSLGAAPVVLHVPLLLPDAA